MLGIKYKQLPKTTRGIPSTLPPPGQGGREDGQFPGDGGGRLSSGKLSLTMDTPAHLLMLKTATKTHAWYQTQTTSEDYTGETMGTPAHFLISVFKTATNTHVWY